MLEAYLLDFAGDLYGKEIEAEFIAFLRPDQTFATPEALSVQMGEGLRAGARAFSRPSTPTTRCAAFRSPALSPSAI